MWIRMIFSCRIDCMGGSLQYIGKGGLGHGLGSECAILEHGSGSLEVAYLLGSFSFWCLTVFISSIEVISTMSTSSPTLKFNHSNNLNDSHIVQNSWVNLPRTMHVP
jgi:hypothetical protein